MKYFLIAALLAIAAPASAAPAEPLTSVDTFRTTVRFSDLPLDLPAGAEAMLARIRSAALRVCGKAPAGRELRDRENHRACLSATMDAAVQQVNAPLVTARYGLKGPPTQIAAR